jgi:hypothetical protein
MEVALQRYTLGKNLFGHGGIDRWLPRRRRWKAKIGDGIEVRFDVTKAVMKLWAQEPKEVAGMTIDGDAGCSEDP